MEKIDVRGIEKRQSKIKWEKMTNCLFHMKNEDSKLQNTEFKNIIR